MKDSRRDTSRLRAGLLSSIAAAAVWVANASGAAAALTASDKVAIQQQVAQALSAANTKNEGDVAAIAQGLDEVTLALLQKYGAADAREVTATVVGAALDDGAPSEAVGRGLALAALNLNGPLGNSVADGVGSAADPATLAAFNQNALASNTPEGTQVAQEAEKAQGASETAGDRHEPKRKFAFRSVIVPGTGIAGGPVYSRGEVNALTGRQEPDAYYQPRGIPLGAPFRMFANFYGSVSYDDNVYRSHTGKLDSPFFTGSPTLVLDYDTSRVKADLYGDMSIYNYTSTPQADTTTYDAGLRWQYDITQAAIFAGNVSQSLSNEDLQSPNGVVGEARADQFNLFDASGTFTYKRGRIGLVLGSSADLYSFTATPLKTGGLKFSHDRNNDIYKGYAIVSYDFSPGYSIFARGTYNDDHYNSAVPDRNGSFRSSHGVQFDGGVNLLLTDLANGQVFVGYMQQDYIHYLKPGASATLPDISGLDFGANLNWFPTELLTLHLSAARQLENTILPGASAGDDRNVTLSAEYEVLRQFTLTGNVGYDDTNLKGSSPRRDDRTLSLGLGGKWLINHSLWADVKYEYSNRSSSIPSVGYVDNIFSIGLNAQI